MACNDTPPTRYVRWQSPTRHPRRDIHVGVFALVNGLRAAGALTPAEEAMCIEGHAWYNAAYPDPSKVHPEVYDRAVNECAAAWFKTTSSHLLDRLPPYLALLDAHFVTYEVLHSDDPGRIIYEDPDQIVVVPYPASA